MMGASELIKDLSTDNVSRSKNLLNDLKKCSVDIKVKGKLLIIKIFLNSQSKEISSIISVPYIFESSPALAV